MPDNLRHHISTYKEAEEILNSYKDFWVVDCFCRTKKGNKCKMSKSDVCLGLSAEFIAFSPNYKKITKQEAMKIFDYAKEKKLIASPLYDMKDKSKYVAFCFCCNDCCNNFDNNFEIVDKGNKREKTDRDTCSDCLACVDYCYYGARVEADGKLKIDASKCYGCGICEEVCPSECISMK